MSKELGTKMLPVSWRNAIKLVAGTLVAAELVSTYAME